MQDNLACKKKRNLCPFLSFSTLPSLLRRIHTDMSVVPRFTQVQNKYFFASFNNDRGVSLDDKTKDYVDRNTEGQLNSLNEVTQLK